jgi:threonine dehydratase
MTNDAPDFAAIEVAAARIAPHAQRTPVLRSRTLDALAGAQLFFKCEHLQRSGAFKFRGACNAVWSLDEDEARRGVVTHSSGNHGAALALAARTRGIAAHVVVPEGAVRVKLEAIAAYGATVHACAATTAAREQAANRVQAQTGATLVHPYTDARVIAGQGTAALELLDEVGTLDALIAPIGGGGLIGGSAIAAHALDPAMALYAAEPSGAADAFQSLRRGARVTDIVPDTICDGLRATLGEINLALLRRHSVQVLPVDDAATIAAMKLLWRRMKQLVEPSSSTVLAAVLANPEFFAGRRVGVILSGGNIDPN